MKVIVFNWKYFLNSIINKIPTGNIFWNKDGKLISFEWDEKYKVIGLPMSTEGHISIACKKTVSFFRLPEDIEKFTNFVKGTL